MNEPTTISRPQSIGSASGSVVVPAAIAGAGEHATRRFLEFFAATIRNRNARMDYYRACCSFFAWLILAEKIAWTWSSIASRTATVL
jgi:hypothetical protein